MSKAPPAGPAVSPLTEKMLSAVRQHAPGLHAHLPPQWQRNAHHTPDQDDGDDAAGADDAVSAKVALGPLGRASDGISQQGC